VFALNAVITKANLLLRKKLLRNFTLAVHNWQLTNDSFRHQLIAVRIFFISIFRQLKTANETWY